MNLSRATFNQIIERRGQVAQIALANMEQSKDSSEPVDPSPDAAILPVLKSLSFPDSSTAEAAGVSVDHLPCILCDLQFLEVEEKDVFLKHLLIQHKLVISEVNLVANFKSYVLYWKKRFEGRQLPDFCFVIQTNSKETDPAASEKYFLLCDKLGEDRELRERLQTERLEQVLSQQQKEREDQSLSRNCLFCKTHFDGNRANLFSHMHDKHGFVLGDSDNLVYVEKFLDKLEARLDKLECIFCERGFKDWASLRDHMRKKQHKRVNPDNRDYDQFYIINYLELGKSWHAVLAEDDRELFKQQRHQPPEEEWSDWREVDSITSKAVCLFCSFSSLAIDDLWLHMKAMHTFDFAALKEKSGLGSFYSQVKVINFIRRRVYQQTCIYCNTHFLNHKNLLDHMQFTGHINRLPSDQSIWNQPQFFFPTYENDKLLYSLEEDDSKAEGAVAGEGEGDGDGACVIGETDACELSCSEECQRRHKEIVKELKTAKN